MSMRGSDTTASVVLVHGAWADGSSWVHVIKPLQSRELKVLAAPIPLTSLSNDVAALERALERTDGPLVLVAHAYAGAVIGASINERVRSLVFIAALAPDEGETVGEVFYREKPHPEAPQLTPDRQVSSGCPMRDLALPFVSTPHPSRPLSSPQRSVPLPSHAFKKRRRSRRGRQSPLGIWSLKKIG